MMFRRKTLSAAGHTAAIKWWPIAVALVIVAASGRPGCADGLGSPVEVDSQSGAEVYVLGGDARPADNIYGEQPYGDASGRRIAIRYYSTDDTPGGITIFDIQDGSRHEVLSGRPPFPAFHARGEWLYCAQVVEGKNLLRRCN